jgi:sterol 3beta-glucosyltransferase
MYITPKHVCFFAHMPDGDVSDHFARRAPQTPGVIQSSADNMQTTVVKTGPLSKRASRTKLSTKWWAVLKKDVLSWYEAASVRPSLCIWTRLRASCIPKRLELTR